MAVPRNKVLSQWESDHFPEKVRVGLLWPTASHAVILIGLKQTILVWDSKEAITVDKVSLHADILDMKYVQVQDSEYLAVLFVDGRHKFFKAHSASKFLEHKKLNLLVHKNLVEPPVYGVLACCQDLIASSLGNGVIVRDLRVPKSLFANIKHSSLFEGQSQHSSVTQMLLPSPAKLLVFSAKSKLFVDYDLNLNGLNKIIVLDYYPTYVTYSPAKRLIVINDPQSGSHFVDAVSFKPRYKSLPPNIANINNRALPSYLCFNEDGNNLAAAEHDSLCYHQITDSGILSTVIPVTCVRFYGLMVEMSTACDGVRITAILRPSRKTEWKIQVSHLTPDTCLPGLSSKQFAIEDAHYDLQTSVCDYDDRNKYRVCTSCRQAHIRGSSPSIQECRFHHFRFLRRSEGEFPEVFSKLPVQSAEHHPSFNSDQFPDSEGEQDAIAIAQAIHPLLIKELLHIQRPGLHVRFIDSETYRLCDICYMGFFFEAWCCGFCGFEVCGMCYMSLVPSLERVPSLDPCPNQHAQCWFIPVSYFTEHKVKTMVTEIETVLAAPIRSSEPGIGGLDRSRNTSSILVSEFKLIGETFLKTWSLGNPFISVDAIKDVEWETFSDLLVTADHMSAVEFFDGYSWRQTNDCSVEDFLKSRTAEQNWPRRIVVDHFDRNLRQSYPALQGKINMVLDKLSSSLGRSINLCPSFPLQHAGSSCMTLSIFEKNSHIQGASPLRFNMCGTILFMLAAAGADARGAEWDIWHKDSIPLLSRALDPSASEEEWELGVPIHAQARFVTNDLSEVAASFGHLRHWKHIQKPGEALFIPPGCCSQAVHLSSCVTLIIKFVRAADVPSIQEIATQIRAYNLLQNRKQYYRSVQIAPSEITAESVPLLSVPTDELRLFYYDSPPVNDTRDN